MLYKEPIIQGDICQGVHSIEELKDIKLMKGRCNIVHIHWVNMFFRKEMLPLHARESFFTILNLKKKQGFKVYWTVHNALSHDSQDIEGEIEFRKKMYRLSNRVFVHHPLALNLLDWLPGSDKIRICEHGHYNLKESNQISKTAARKKLGISHEEFVLTFIGHVKPYKGLEDVLPTLLQTLQECPNLIIIIAGKVYSDAVREMIENVSHERLQILDFYQSQEDLLLQMKAADVGFVSYRSILTSGTLMHWLTCGRPVIAPDKGIIPYYICNGWNGALYKNASDLQRLIRLLLNMPKSTLEKMGANASQTAKVSKWELTL